MQKFSQKADIKKMIRKFRLLFFGSMFVLCFLASGYGQEESETGVRHNGVVFNIAKDRRVEKVGGIYEPEGLDKYVDRRMSEISEKMQKLEGQVELLLKKLDEMNEKITRREPSADPSQKKMTSL